MALTLTRNKTANGIDELADPADRAGAPSGFGELLAEVGRCWARPPDKPEETAEGVARALWLAAAGTPASVERAAAMALPELDAAGDNRLRALLARKQSGEPLAHLTGRQSFLGLELLSGPAALIPRKETEILGRAVLEKLNALAKERGEIRVVDVCTGSGNLALAYAHHESAARVWGADLSVGAVELARRNARHCALASRVEFIESDLLSAFENGEFLGRCDVVSCNPPYISAAKVSAMHHEISGFEPELAFNGGTFGISILTRFLREAPRFLKPASWLALEVGAGQGLAIARQLAKNPALSIVEPRTDAAGQVRAVLARTH
jgi:release factor glutamine methyltransferase